MEHLQEMLLLAHSSCTRPAYRVHASTCLSENLQVTWPKTLLVVSHAREFLNAVTTDTIHLHSRKLTTYKGAAWAIPSSKPLVRPNTRSTAHVAGINTQRMSPTADLEASLKHVPAVCRQLRGV